MVHDVLEGPALVDIELVTCFLVHIPVIDHGRDGVAATSSLALLVLALRCVFGRNGWKLGLGAGVELRWWSTPAP